MIGCVCICISTCFFSFLSFHNVIRPPILHTNPKAHLILERIDVCKFCCPFICHFFLSISNYFRDDEILDRLIECQFNFTKYFIEFNTTYGKGFFGTFSFISHVLKFHTLISYHLCQTFCNCHKCFREIAN